MRSWFAGLVQRMRSALSPRSAAPEGRPLTRRDLRRLRRGGAGGIVLAALLVVCIGLVVAVVLKTEADAATAAREAQAYRPPSVGASATPTTPGSSGSASASTSVPQTYGTGPLVTVVGDGLTVAPATGGGTPWPATAATQLDARMTVLGGRASGYTTGGAGTFVRQAGTVDAASRVVVFVGGVRDAGAGQFALLKAATRAYAAATARAPNTRLVVVGPAWPTADPPRSVRVVTDALQRSAALAEATWVDPVSRGWLRSPGRLSADGTHTTAAGQRELASDLVPVLQPLLAAPAG